MVCAGEHTTTDASNSSTNSPNSIPRSPQPYRPAPHEIVAKREAAGLTQLQLGDLLYAARRTVQDWEKAKRRMPALAWEYLCLLVDYPEVAAARERLLSSQRAA